MRFDFYGQSDTRDDTSGDKIFQGIDMTRDRPLLQPGMLSLGENTRTRTGNVKPRKGTMRPPDFNPGSGLNPPIAGSSVFRNPNGQEVLIIAPEDKDYTIILQDTQDPYQVPYATNPPDPIPVPTGDNGPKVQLVQAFEQVLLLRNPLVGQENLVWDGQVGTKWQVMQLSAEGLKVIPGVWNGEPFMDRIIYYFANAIGVARRDTWLLSDVLDYTSYDDVFQSFRTNAGDADTITRIMSYFRGSVVIFKNHSIHMASVQATYPVSVTQRILNSTVGSVGNKMPLMVGGDIIFLSQPNGFYLLSEIIQDQITALPLPISEPIQRVIDDINWTITAEQGCSAALDNYAFFGVCLKSLPDQHCLNAILVYDTQRKVWESAGDTWADPAFCFSALHVTNYGNVHRLFAVDYIRGIVYLLYEGLMDEMTQSTFSIPFKMETRGYSGDDPISFKRFGRAIVGIRTNDPSVTVTAITDGFNEEKILTPDPITKDRFTFYTHGTPPFNPNGGDEDAPYREDYSVVVEQNFIARDYEEITVGGVESISPTLIPQPDQEQQESVERFLVRSHGAWCALRIENTQGTCEVTSVSIESTHSMNTNRTAA